MRFALIFPVSWWVACTTYGEASRGVTPSDGGSSLDGGSSVDGAPSLTGDASGFIDTETPADAARNRLCPGVQMDVDGFERTDALGPPWTQKVMSTAAEEPHIDPQSGNPPSSLAIQMLAQELGTKSSFLGQRIAPPSTAGRCFEIDLRVSTSPLITGESSVDVLRLESAGTSDLMLTLTKTGATFRGAIGSRSIPAFAFGKWVHVVLEVASAGGAILRIDGDEWTLPSEPQSSSSELNFKIGAYVTGYVGPIELRYDNYRRTLFR